MKTLSSPAQKLLLFIVLSGFCRAGDVSQPPDWAADAIWYQIFPERFYNGDTANDPTINSLYGTWPWDIQETWNISPWTSDWYQLQPWEKANGQLFNYQSQIRRYGGDIQGIIEKLDYLQDLGINAIYLNPVFDSPSSHKYGAANYHHIDRHFGPDPFGDAAIMATEDPADPSTWKWTSADQLFLTLVREVHQRDMHIIIDGVFNHVGLTFWAFRDVIEHREKSPYYSWFVIEGAPGKDESHLNEFQSLPALFLHANDSPLRYKGYVADLPAFRQNKDGLIPPVAEHIQAVVSRWMDPNGDGNPEDGIDGWRLDVAERVQLPFWKKFRTWVRDNNPNAYLTGEIWWEDWWNNKQFNAAPWLEGNAFDAVMNYRFTDAMYKFFIDEEQQINATELDHLLQGVRNDYRPETWAVLQNLLDSHDMERVGSGIVNPDRWIDHANNLQYNFEFDVRKPSADEIQILKAITTFQFAYQGAPYIYYGDEVGMWGADDPDCRKPMVWDEFDYDDEVVHPCDYHPDCSETRPRNTVEVNTDLFQHYQELIKLRKSYPCLRRGSYKTVTLDNQHHIFAFQRQDEQHTMLAVINGASQPQPLNDEVFPGKRSEWTQIFGQTSTGTQKDIPGKTGYLYKLK